MPTGTPKQERHCRQCSRRFFSYHNHQRFCSARCRLLGAIQIIPWGCWEWTGSKISAGYGAFRWNRTNRYAHRESHRIFNGPIPKGLYVCHHCDNPGCVNPEHLYAGTAKDNAEDSVKRGRRSHLGCPGERHGMSKLNEMQVRIIRRLYPLGGWSHREIGELFGVTATQVCAIVHRKTWKHI